MPKNRSGLDESMYDVGFCKPPVHARFQKGTTGNPKGRPKGAKGIHSILSVLGRERVKVTINGRARTVTKLDAVFMQLINKAASGDLKAIRELFTAYRLFPEPVEGLETVLATDERDKAVLKNIVSKIKLVKEGQ